MSRTGHGADDELMDTTTHPPPPPQVPAAAPGPGPRRLRRGADKKIAGVCDGLGRHFGIDPTIIRILFVAAAVLGGSGVLLYLVAWLVMPAADSPADQGMEIGGGSQNAAGLVALIIGAVLLFWMVGPGPIWGLTIPLLLIGVGIAILVRDPDGDEAPAQRPAPSPSPSPRPTDEPPEEPSGATVEPTMPVEEHETTTTPATRTPGELPPPPPTDAPPESYVPAAPKEPEAEHDDSTVITPLVLSLLLLGGGIALALHLADWVDVSALAIVSGGLVIIGGGLIASAFTGRARGLVPLGILFALAIPVTAAVEPAIRDGVGDREYVVTSFDDLERRYELGIGDLVVDLSELDFDGETVRIDVDLSIGNAEVTVPSDVEVRLTSDVDLGRIEVFGVEEDGVSNEVDGTYDAIGESRGLIVLDLEVDLGNAEVHR